MKELILTIFLVCEFSKSQIKTEKKINCMEIVLNCTIKGTSSGEYLKKDLDECILKYSRTGSN